MSKVKETKKEVKVGKSKLDYHLEVQVNDLVYKGEAVSLTQAFTDFVNSPVYPFNVKTRVLVRYGNGKVEKQLTWPTMMGKRKFNLIQLKPTHLEFLADKLTSNLAN